jgi:hypothetical protein
VYSWKLPVETCTRSADRLLSGQLGCAVKRQLGLPPCWAAHAHISITCTARVWLSCCVLLSCHAGRCCLGRVGGVQDSSGFLPGPVPVAISFCECWWEWPPAVLGTGAARHSVSDLLCSSECAAAQCKRAGKLQGRRASLPQQTPIGSHMV